MDISDQRLKALEWFKDWSNYLLVTSVAALGWIASENGGTWAQPALKSFAVWCLGLSIVFGIFTLALIPLVTQQLEEHRSIYSVPASFSVLGIQCHAYIPQACRPQHVLFICGVLGYCMGKGPGLSIGTAIFVMAAAAIIGLMSRPKER